MTRQKEVDAETCISFVFNHRLIRFHLLRFLSVSIGSGGKAKALDVL